MSTRRKQNFRPSPYEFRKHRKTIKKFRKYVGKFLPLRIRYIDDRSGNDQPKIRKIEVI